MTTSLAQTLIDQGYTGATGTTPYKPASAGQITQLQNIYNQSLTGQVNSTASTNAIHININFDGTQNNGAFPAAGESKTNVWKLSDLQRKAGDQRNTIYESGIGAQTVPTGTLDAKNDCFQKHSCLRNQIERYKAKRHSKPCANDSAWRQVA